MRLLVYCAASTDVSARGLAVRCYLVNLLASLVQRTFLRGRLGDCTDATQQRHLPRGRLRTCHPEIEDGCRSFCIGE